MWWNLFSNALNVGKFRAFSVNPLPIYTTILPAMRFIGVIKNKRE
jgi:hypothetical protein